MKYILLSLLALSASADLKEFVNEYLGQSHEVKQLKYSYDLQLLSMELEDEKRPWTLAASTEYEDSKLETSPFSLAPSGQKFRTDVLALSKEFIWGGEFTFSGTHYDLDSSSSFKSYSQSLEYSQDLGANLFGRNDFLSLDIAEETANYQKLKFEGSKSKSIVLLVNDYLQVRREKTLLDLQRQAFSRSLKRLNLIKKQVKDGIKERVDLYSSQTAHSFQSELLEEKSAALENALRDLETRMERKVSLRKIEAFEISEKGLKPVPQGSIDENFDVKAIKKKLSYLKKSVDKSDNSIFPTITLKGTYSTNNYDTTKNPISDGTFGSDNDSKALALTVSIPLGFDVQKNALKVARLNKMEAEYDKRLTLVSVKNNIENFKRNLARLDKNIASVAKRYKLAQKTVTEYNRLYNRGRANLDQVIRAEEDLINTESAFVEYKIAREKQYYGLLDIYGQLESHMRK